MSSIAAITGARGWLGSCVARWFTEQGWEVRGLVRAPARPAERRLVLGEEVEAGALEGVEALVHCAYDFQPRGWAEIERVNVQGSAVLLRAAAAAGVRRVVAISTMSAFPGCRSLYGRAKLAIEQEAARHGALVLRPGLIAGAGAGGMMGALEQQVKSARIVPLLAGDAVLYAVQERDLCARIFSFCQGTEPAPSRPLVAAHPEPWPFRRLLAEVARRAGRRPLFFPLPWRAIWLGLRVAEALGLQPPFRSDSLLSLAHQDPHPDFDGAAEAGFQPRGLTEFGT